MVWESEPLASYEVNGGVRDVTKCAVGVDDR